MRIAAAATLMLVALVACDVTPRPEPVVVYASGEDETYWSSWFAGFTDETRIPVTVKFGESATHTDFVIENKGSPPADVLLTANVADIWRAADKGALRPIRTGKMSIVPGNLRDPDGFWVAQSYRLAVIVNHRQTGNPIVNSYEYLARPELSGQLCLSSSELALSRSLIAMLIIDLGPKPAERLVRGWVRNLATAPYPSEIELLEAVRSGTCVYGILSDTLADGSIGVSVPEPAYFDIRGAGVARHSRHPESAQLLIEWIIEEQSLQAVIASQHNVGVAGWRDEDARLLAERAGYR